MAAKLKVFVTSDGLTDYVVATTSRPKALEAWGVNQDLFKDGRAHETDDPALVEAATAKPGEVVTRSTGAEAPDLPRAKTSKPAAKAAKPAKPAGPTPAQLRRIDELERRLQALKAGFEETLDSIEMERQGLNERESRERGRY